MIPLKIDLIAPSHCTTPEKLKLILDYCEKNCIDIRVSKNFFSTDFDKKAHDFLDAFYQSDSNVVCSVQGGYGAGQMISNLPNKMNFKPPFKIFSGFSDATIIHSWIHHHFKFTTLHGIVLAYGSDVDEKGGQGPIMDTMNVLKQMVNHEPCRIQYELKTMNESARIFNAGSIKIVGGNLCLIQTTMGTSIQLNAKKQFILIEDVKEFTPKLRRMMDHLDRVGVIKECAGLIMGSMDAVMSEPYHEYVQEVADWMQKKYSKPVFYYENFGHGSINSPLPLNHYLSIRDNILSF
jgi:muramoyltetrapeptide carboxypeptidase